MRARYYTRVSTEDQAREGFSLPAQQDRCQSYIRSQGWEVTGAYQDDGYSAKDLNRPAMQQLIKDIQNNEFDVLVVYRLDRLVRSVIDLHHLLELFEKHKVTFKSVTEIYDTTTANGRLFISVIASLAQWERENLAERVIVGMERRALEGKRNGGVAPFGYRLEDGHLVVNPEEAAVVREIFNDYLFCGMHTIAKKLNEKGIKSPNGGAWSTLTVNYILSNLVYIGNIRWNYRTSKRTPKADRKKQENVVISDGEHDAIINEELFEKVQQKIKERKDKPTRYTKFEYPFSGILYCPRCGDRMHGNRRVKSKGRLDFEYRCSNRTTKSIAACNMLGINERALEAALKKSISLMASDTHSFDPPTAEKPDEKKRIEEIKKELERIKKRKKKWQLAFAEDIISIEELKERTTEDKSREAELEQELDALLANNDTDTPTLTKEEFIERISNFNFYWDSADRREKAQILQSLFKKLVFDIDRDNIKGRRSVKPVVLIEYELV